MKVSADFGKIGIGINEDRLVATLKKVAAPAASAIEINGVSGIEPMHEDIEVALWSHEQ
jgi:hypothetical protein